MVLRIVNKFVEFLKIPIFFILFAYLALWAYANLGGSDYLFHIKAGEYITTQHSVPDKDVFSFTMEGKKWVDHEWLYQVIIYSLYDNLGLNGLFLLKIFIFTSAFFILSVIVLKTDWIFGFPLLFYGLQISTKRFILRPDNFSFLFLIIFLLPFIFKKRKLLFLLPLLQILWVNIHGFFFFGPIILGVYLLSEKIRPDKETEDFCKTVKKVFFLSLAACFITPHPMSTITYPINILFGVFLGGQKIFYNFIQELQSPLKHLNKTYIFMGYLIFNAVYLCFRKNAKYFLLILSVLFGLFCLNSLRNLYFFVPIGIAVFADRHEYVKDFFTRKLVKEKGFMLLQWGAIIFSISICFMLFGKIKTIPHYGRAYITKDNKVEIGSLFFAQDERVFPKDIIDFIEKNELPQNMFNNFNIGAPILFSSFPQRKVFIDGRTELYGKEFFQEYIDVLNCKKEAIGNIIEKYNLEGFIISYFRNKTPVSLIKPIHDRGYKCVYFGTDGIIFVSNKWLKKTPSLKRQVINFNTVKFKEISLIKEVGLTRPSVEGHFKKAYILYMLNYLKPSEKYLHRVLEINPNHAKSYYILSKIEYKEGNYSRAFIYCRKSLIFDSSKKGVKKLLAKIYIKTGEGFLAKDLLSKLNIDFDKFKKGIK